MRAQDSKGNAVPAYVDAEGRVVVGRSGPSCDLPGCERDATLRCPSCNFIQYCNTAHRDQDRAHKRVCEMRPSLPLFQAHPGAPGEFAYDATPVYSMFKRNMDIALAINPPTHADGGRLSLCAIEPPVRTCLMCYVLDYKHAKKKLDPSLLPAGVEGDWRIRAQTRLFGACPHCKAMWYCHSEDDPMRQQMGWPTHQRMNWKIHKLYCMRDVPGINPVLDNVMRTYLATSQFLAFSLAIIIDRRLGCGRASVPLMPNAARLIIESARDQPAARDVIVTMMHHFGMVRPGTTTLKGTPWDLDITADDVELATTADLSPLNPDTDRRRIAWRWVVYLEASYDRAVMPLSMWRRLGNTVADAEMSAKGIPPFRRDDFIRPYQSHPDDDKWIAEAHKWLDLMLQLKAAKPPLEVPADTLD